MHRYPCRYARTPGPPSVGGLLVVENEYLGGVAVSATLTPMPHAHASRPRPCGHACMHACSSMRGMACMHTGARHGMHAYRCAAWHACIQVRGTLVGLTPTAGANPPAGGWHIHTGLTCEEASAVGPHYFPNMPVDPWLASEGGPLYTAGADGVAQVSCMHTCPLECMHACLPLYFSTRPVLTASRRSRACIHAHLSACMHAYLSISLHGRC